MSYESLIRVLGAITPTGWHSTREINDLAKDNEHDVTRRTMERPLDSLLRSPQPPIEMPGGEGPGKAKEWRWRRIHPLKDHAHQEAVLVEKLLLHRMALHLLPPATAQRLNDDAHAALGEVAAKLARAIAPGLEHRWRVLRIPKTLLRTFRPDCTEELTRWPSRNPICTPRSWLPARNSRPEGRGGCQRRCGHDRDHESRLESCLALE